MSGYWKCEVRGKKNTKDHKERETIREKRWKEKGEQEWVGQKMIGEEKRRKVRTKNRERMWRGVGRKKKIRVWKRRRIRERRGREKSRVGREVQNEKSRKEWGNQTCK